MEFTRAFRSSSAKSERRPRERFSPVLLLVVVGLLVVSGCGTNFEEALFQAVNATGRTYLDILITDLANTLVDSLDPGEAPSLEDEVDDGGTPPPVGPPLEELTGDPAAGEGIYVSNSCSACHCAEATGGCALSAPSLVGVTITTVDDRLRGDVDHPGGKFNLTNQDIVDVQAYLSGLDVGNE